MIGVATLHSRCTAQPHYCDSWDWIALSSWAGLLLLCFTASLCFRLHFCIVCFVFPCWMVNIVGCSQPRTVDPPENPAESRGLLNESPEWRAQTRRRRGRGPFQHRECTPQGQTEASRGRGPRFARVAAAGMVIPCEAASMLRRRSHPRACEKGRDQSRG